MDRPYSLYDVLSVPPGASSAALEAAYRRLMKEHHPDRTGAGAGSRAADINAAFSILRDPERRADYDRREGARQRALLDRQVHKLQRRRRVAGWGAWSLAALMVCAATAYAAQHYGARAMARQSASGNAAQPEQAPRERLDPVRVVEEVLAEAKAMSLKSPAPPAAARPARQGASAALPSRRQATLRRHDPAPVRAAAPSRAEAPADGDFLEREGFIY
jgi:curved DNA-binding protein CbpA